MDPKQTHAEIDTLRRALIKAQREFHLQAKSSPDELVNRALFFGAQASLVGRLVDVVDLVEKVVGGDTPVPERLGD